MYFIINNMSSLKKVDLSETVLSLLRFFADIDTIIRFIIRSTIKLVYTMRESSVLC